MIDCGELRAEVLVIGAGPAGAAAAAWLARSGVEVILADQYRFPREKVCGDGLIADALAALKRLGVEAQIRRASRSLDKIRIYAPDRTSAEINAAVACMERRELDETLRTAAVKAGARFVAPLRLLALSDGGPTITAARFSDGRTIHADWVLLATGAASAPLELAGVCRRKAPSGIAARAYFRNTTAQLDHLCLAFDRTVFPGYGWIFPMPGGLFNVGAGYFFGAPHPPAAGNVRRVFEAFAASFKPARDLIAGAQAVLPLKGAALRTGLRGAALHRPGLLVIGEAAGTTYAFSGEGVGKAMESGMLAADQVIACAQGVLPREAVGPAYEKAMREMLAPKFAAYERLQRWLAYPALCNLLAARVRRGRFARAQIEALLAEESDVRELFSPFGLLKAAFA